MSYPTYISPAGGRYYTEDGETVNVADAIAALALELVSVPLTLTQGAGTTLSVTLMGSGAIDLVVPIELVSGRALNKGDIITVVNTGTLTVTGATLVGVGKYAVNGGAPVTVETEA